MNILNTADNAFQEWKKTPFSERQKLLTNVARLLLLHKEQYAQLITQEMNKPIAQSIAEIEKCAGLAEYYANMSPFLEPKTIKTEYDISQVHYEPMGVILGIMPWNFPFWQAIRFAVPTLLAGNGIILKHASICLGSGDAIQQLFEEAGVPSGLLTHIKASHQEIETLIASPIIKAVSLTGSETAGRKIAEIAGRNLKKCVLELGGNDAFIVLEDADIEQAAKDAALARLQNCGQTCVAAKRFIIHSKIYDDFLKLFIQEYQKYQPADPMDKNTILSGMARADLAEDLKQQYNKAILNGAKILLPLQAISDIAFEPGLIEMNEGNPILDEELFGPLGMILKAENDEEALQLANNTQFGLANAVYTKDQNKAIDFAQRLESGSVAINQIFRSDVRMPFGGRKNSGYGVEMSWYALEEFTIKKAIVGKL